MKIKTFEAQTSQEIDRLVNEFEDNNDVKATQTHFFIHDRQKYFVATLFFNPKTDYVPQHTQENTEFDRILPPKQPVQPLNVQPVQLGEPTSNVQIIPPNPAQVQPEPQPSNVNSDGSVGGDL